MDTHPDATGPSAASGHDRRRLDEVNSTPTTAVFRVVAKGLHAIVGAASRREWLDIDKVPSSGAALVVGNHLSWFDPEVMADYLIWAGRWPRFLAKSTLWKVPGLGYLGRSTGQIPVERGTSRAGDSLLHAERALQDGELVVIYPEGTLTKDPELWPMTARPGAARLALQTRVPVIPIAQWGAQAVMPGHGVNVPRLWPRKTVTVQCGDPIDLSDLWPLVGTDRQKEAEKEATERIIARLTHMVAALRGEPAPADRWDLRTQRREPIGGASSSSDHGPAAQEPTQG